MQNDGASGRELVSFEVLTAYYVNTRLTKESNTFPDRRLQNRTLLGVVCAWIGWFKVTNQSSPAGK